MISLFGRNRPSLDDGKKKKPGSVSNGRLLVWIVVGGVALYLIGTGLYGIITKGG